MGTDDHADDDPSSSSLKFPKLQDPPKIPRIAEARANAQLEGKKIKYAGFLVRLGAAILDGFLLGIGIVILMVPGLLLGSRLLSGLGLLVWIVTYLLYFTIGDYKFGKTLGKHLLGLRVVDKELATPLKLSTAAIREILGRGLVDRITFGLGNLLIIFDGKKQALHDKIAGTYVVHEKESEITVR